MKKVLYILFVLILISGMASCYNNGEPGNEIPNATEETPNPTQTPNPNEIVLPKDEF